MSSNSGFKMRLRRWPQPQGIAAAVSAQEACGKLEQGGDPKEAADKVGGSTSEAAKKLEGSGTHVEAATASASSIADPHYQEAIRSLSKFMSPAAAEDFMQCLQRQVASAFERAWEERRTT
jgi:hypothetical protein